MGQITFKNYLDELNIGEDYHLIHEFLLRLESKYFSYARFDWMFTNLEYLEKESLKKIGMWFDDNKLVGLTLFDFTLDCVFVLTLKDYKYLYDEMIKYSLSNMIKNKDNYFLFVLDDDIELKQRAMDNNLIKTDYDDTTLILDLFKVELEPNLSRLYSFTTLKDELDFKKYALCLFKGFDHEKNETFKFDEDDVKRHQIGYLRNEVDLSLKVSIKDINGDYIAHCGVWYDKNNQYAIIEPVCVIPSFRNQSLGSKVVLEGLKRAKEKGAKYALVNSNNIFYKRLGFKELSKGHFYKIKD